MRLYKVHFDANRPAPKQVNVPSESKFALGISIEKNGSTVDLTTGQVTLEKQDGTTIDPIEIYNQKATFNIETAPGNADQVLKFKVQSPAVHGTYTVILNQDESSLACGYQDADTPTPVPPTDSPLYFYEPGYYQHDILDVDPDAPVVVFDDIVRDSGEFRNGIAVVLDGINVRNLTDSTITLRYRTAIPNQDGFAETTIEPSVEWSTGGSLVLTIPRDDVVITNIPYVG